MERISFPVPGSASPVSSPGGDNLGSGRLLDRGLLGLQQGLLVVTAPAGFGKSSLLRRLAAAHGRAAIVQVDPSARTGDPFARAVASALRDACGPGARASFSAGDQPADPHAVLDGALDATRALGAPVALLVDDVPVAGGSPTDEFLLHLVERRPPNLALGLAGRRDPFVAPGRHGSSVRPVELRARDLALEVDEVRAVAEAVGGLRGDEARRLHGRTGGWPVVVEAVIRHLGDHGESRPAGLEVALRSAVRALGSFLDAEVLAGLGPELAGFVTAISMLERVETGTAAVATAMSAARASDLIDAVRRAGLLEEGDEATWTATTRRPERLQPFLGEHLRDRLHDEVGREELAIRHREVARILEPDDWLASVRHVVEAGDGPAAPEVVARQMVQILATGGARAAREVLDRWGPTPPRPGLTLVRARATLSDGLLDEARSLALTAVRAGVEEADRAVARRGRSELARIERLAGRPAPAAAFARQVIELGSSGDPAEELFESEARLALDAAESRGDLPLAARADALERLAARAEAAGEVGLAGRVHLDLARIELARGEAERADAAASRALGQLATSDGAPQERAQCLLVRAAVAAANGRWSQATGLIREALDPWRAQGGAALAAGAADLAGWFGDPLEAVRLLATTDAACPLPERIDGDGLALARAGILLRAQRLDEARDLLASIEPWSNWAEPAADAARLTMLARIAVRAGDADVADRIEIAIGHASRIGAAGWARLDRVLETLAGPHDALSGAVAASAEADPSVLTFLAEEVGARLADLDERCLELVTAQTVAFPDRWRPVLRALLEGQAPALRSIAGGLLEEIGEPADLAPLRQVARVVRGRHADRNLGRRLARRLAQPLFIEDQGRVGLRLGDRLIVGGPDLRRKVLGLLCFLVTRPDLSATGEQVLEAMWPDQDPIAAEGSLNQTIYYLRRAIESPYCEDRSPGYIHHAKNVVWLDTDLVSSRSRRCWDLVNRYRPGSDGAIVDELSEAYLDRFGLDVAYEEWAVPYRDALHAAYLSVIERGAEDAAGNGQLERAIALTRRALQIDPDAHQLEFGLLRYYVANGTMAAAAEQYAHYASVMRDEYGVEPPALSDLCDPHRGDDRPGGPHGFPRMRT